MVLIPIFYTGAIMMIF